LPRRAINTVAYFVHFQVYFCWGEVFNLSHTTVLLAVDLLQAITDVIKYFIVILLIYSVKFFPCA